MMLCDGMWYSDWHDDRTMLLCQGYLDTCTGMLDWLSGNQDSYSVT